MTVARETIAHEPTAADVAAEIAGIRGQPREFNARHRPPGLIDVLGRLEDRVRVLGMALAQWAYRDGSKPQPDVRQAANTAMDEIDAMLAELHRIRSVLMGEIREADDAAAARVDAMLAQCRDGAR